MQPECQLRRQGKVTEAAGGGTPRCGAPKKAGPRRRQVGLREALAACPSYVLCRVVNALARMHSGRHPTHIGLSTSWQTRRSMNSCVIYHSHLRRVKPLVAMSPQRLLINGTTLGRSRMAHPAQSSRRGTYGRPRMPFQHMYNSASLSSQKAHWHGCHQRRPHPKFSRRAAA